MDEQPNENRPSVPTWVWIITIFAVIVGLQLVFSGSFRTEEISQQEFFAKVQNNEVDIIELSGDRLEAFRDDAGDELVSVGVTTKDSQSSLEDVLAFNGLDNATLQELSVEVQVRNLSLRNNVVSILFTIGPVLLLIWIFSRGFRQMQGGGGNSIFGFGRSRAKNLSDADRPTVTFDDVAGVDEAKLELAEVVQFLREPEKFVQVGARIPKGVLMVGPPGTGKTLLARAVAGEAGVPFFHISGSEFVEMFVGVGASRVRDLFEKAKQSAPSIVFVDEIDAVGRQRGAGLGGGHDEREQTLNQILVEMDGFDNDTNVIVMAATNRADILDPALLRPGRFDRKVFVDLPDVKGREKILEVHARGKPISKEVELKEFAKLTAGFSGADLENLLNEAAIFAARRDQRTIGNLEFQDAFDRIALGPEKKSRVMSQEDKETVAYHEAGHAVVSFFLPNTDPVQKITIVPRGRAGGYVMPLPEDRMVYSREYILDNICWGLGGRAAEEIFFSRITTGASSDLQNATRRAKAMIMNYGMSDVLGLPTYGDQHSNPFVGRDYYGMGGGRDYSEDAAKAIDEEVKKILNENYTKAKKIIEDNRDKLVALANRLLEVETMDRVEFEKLMNEPYSENGRAMRDSLYG
ncbi:MAG: ATP-dependent metallopeptidase FtsH/Yme1/Tma family protein [Ardenticatenaceae bacterium]|nr:ATP-dependent zinc metalloprotease FtsH [Anaerolineales bacterium]MCB8940534.1 ATP-dependent metallopeptidase FtsH/Yme1/Tma family protein [Ardenticatenaceae bacterium]MCB8973555.1 ATP-dependent metallopeptidase FtsH/Yme1/Tma family protein [Ardenticatenaceae bacterium]